MDVASNNRTYLTDTKTNFDEFSDLHINCHNFMIFLLCILDL